MSTGGRHKNKIGPPKIGGPIILKTNQSATHY